MAFATRSFDSPQELVDYLNDLILSKPLTVRISGLDSLTLDINDGADKTVTFVDSGDGLSLAQVVSQINAVAAGFVSLRDYGHNTAPQQKNLVFIKDGGVVKDSGTANALLGLPTSGGNQTVGGSAVAKADIVSVVHADGERYVVIHE